MKRLLLVWTILGVWGGLGCSSSQKEGDSAQPSYEITSRGSDKMGAACEKFDLSKDQVQIFFEKAQKISLQDIYQQYDFEPCWVKGNRTVNGETSIWRIRSRGVGEIAYPNGSIAYFGCKTCPDLFQY